MGRKAIDLTDKVFADGNLTVLGRAPGQGSGKRALWRCRCGCGKECVVIGEHLRKGLTRSCGCLRAKTFINNLHEGRRRALEARQRARVVPTPKPRPTTLKEAKLAAEALRREEAAAAASLSAAFGYPVREAA